MSKECITNCKLEDTGFNYTMSLIQGKYKMFILYTLMEFEVVRFNEMQKYIGGITYKTLSSTLKQLEASGLINRKEYPRFHQRLNTVSPNAENHLFRFWTKCATGVINIVNNIKTHLLAIYLQPFFLYARYSSL